MEPVVKKVIRKKVAMKKKDTVARDDNNIVSFVRSNDIISIPTKFHYSEVNGKKKKLPCFLNKIKFKGEDKFSPNMGVPFYKWTKAMVKSHCEFLKQYDKLSSCDGVVVILYNTNWIMIDTDDEDGETEIASMSLFKSAPITKSLTKKFGRHRYIKLEKSGNYKSELKINNKEIDIITEYSFEGMTSVCDNANTTSTITIKEFNEALNIEMYEKDLNAIEKYTKKHNIGSDRKFKVRDTIRNDFLNEDETIPQDLLFKILKGLDVNKFATFTEWKTLLIGVFNQALNIQQDLTYKMEFMEFMKKHEKWEATWDRENDKTWEGLKNNNYGGNKIKSGTIWRFLQQQNKDLFIELKGQRRNQIDPPSFNMIGDYFEQKRRFEKDCFVVKSDKATYCEMDNIVGELKERTHDNFKQVHCCLKTLTTSTDKKGKTTTKETPFCDRWIDDATRREYDRMDFLPPPLDCSQFTYNFYNGLYIDDIENEEFETMNEEDREKKIERILNHIYYLVGCDNDCYTYLLKVLAFKYRYPALLHKISCVFKSKQGCGKNAFLDWFGEKVLGKPYYCCSSNADDFVGKFNSMIKGKLMIVFNEMDGQAGYNHSARLKEFATEATINHEKKGVDRKKITNCALTCYASNSENPVKVEIGDRRFFVVECSDRVLYIEGYFEELFEDLEDPCVAKCFCWFLEKRVEVNRYYNFKLNRPFTRAYKDLQHRNKPQLVRFIEYLLADRKTISDTKYTGSQLWDKFTEYQSYNNVKNKWDRAGFNAGMVKFTYKHLEDLGDKDIDKVIHHTKQSVYYYRFNKVRSQALVDSYDLDKDYEYEDGEDYEEDSDDFCDSD